ncbi:MAG: glycosyltransferase [Phycisphaerae bacterium]|jgi:glycosyltransferase involved in cell wall biosynthesis
MRRTMQRQMHAPGAGAAFGEAGGSSPGETERRCTAILTHHWLVRHRGGEKVLAALRELLPTSPIHTLVYDRRGTGGRWTNVHASWLRFVPGAPAHYPKLLALLAWTAERTRLPPADLVLCSDAAMVKAMRPHGQSKVICYCHSPMRYVWDDELRAVYERTLSPPARALFRWSADVARRVDARGAARVDQFIANSRFVADRIRRWYGREAAVVHPPVDLPPAPHAGPREDYYLFVGHNAPYKRLDLAIEACRRLGRRLVVIGEQTELRSGDHGTKFLGYQPDDVLHEHYRRARGLLFPGVEDFGLIPVEAMANGCPVIALGAGGAVETVSDGTTGVLFQDQTVEGLKAGIERAEAMRFDAPRMHVEMQRFGRQRFLTEMRAWIARVLNQRRPS